MKRARIFVPALFAVLLIWNCGGGASAPEKGIENGLRPIVPVEGWEPWTLAERMEYYGVPGVSVAVIDDHEIVWSEAFGVADSESGTPVTPETLFQAGQLSSLAAAVTALAEVGEGDLSLDGPISEVLQAWQLPENALTAETPVTLRHLLSHTAGINVGQYQGYQAGEDLPTLDNLLRGEVPSKSPRVSIDSPPGRQFNYSVNGYLIVQQALSELSGQSFAEIAEEEVFTPLGLERSTFAQPLPGERRAEAAVGHLASGERVAGQAKVYPQTATFGLWTTPSEFATLLLEISRSQRDGQGAVLNAELVGEMSRPVVGGAALGAFLSSQGGVNRLSAGGFTDGFFARFVLYPDQGKGAVVMTNSDYGQSLVPEILNAVAAAHDWPNYLQPKIEPVALEDEQLAALAARFGLGPDRVFVTELEGGRLTVRELLSIQSPFPTALAPTAEDTFVRVDSGQRVGFRVDRRGLATALTFQGPNGQEVVCPRLADEDVKPVELLAEGEVEEALELFRSRETVAEPSLNVLGYSLLRRGDLEASIAVFGLNTELHPDSANVWDSLADAYLAAGDEQKALEAVQKAAENLPIDSTTAPGLREIVEAKVRYYLAKLEGAE